MPRLSIIFGLILLLIGRVGYVAAETNSVTAMIPDLFGLGVIILGVAAAGSSDRARMHAMHGAVLIALAGAVVAGYRGIPGALAYSSGDRTRTCLEISMQLAMTLACILFVILAIRSFIQARRGPA
ncbi:MAG: hypothetical protein ACE5GE_12315 [Phycisphaerae bacterium]